MSRRQTKEKLSFFRTLPGMLTAVAAIISAIAALIAATFPVLKTYWTDSKLASSEIVDDRRPEEKFAADYERAFCARLKRLVVSGETGFETAKGPALREAMWSPRIEIPGMNCYVSATRGSPSYNCYTESAPLAFTTEQHVKMMSLVKTCLGSEWMSIRLPNMDNAFTVADGATFEREAGDLVITVSIDSEDEEDAAAGATGHLTITAH